MIDIIDYHCKLPNIKHMYHPNYILASSSPYRKTLLEKLQISFECISPDIDETPHMNELPQDLVARLAQKKAYKVSQMVTPPSVIIASDQVATFKDKILGKPHTTDNAIQQLSQFSNQCVTFYTSLCVIDTKSNIEHLIIEPFKVYFRELATEEIKTYIEKEMPLNCAGSFKSEGLGITLFKKLEGDDPNTLIGLPLIKLCQILRKLNILVL